MSLFEDARALTREAGEVFDLLDLGNAFPSVGPPIVTGSAYSGLMVLRDLDVMFDAPTATANDILAGLTILGTRVEIRAADFRDERGDRRPTPKWSDERFYLVLHVVVGKQLWKVDLTFWVHVVARPQVAAGDRLRAATREEKLAILRLKSTCPQYPDTIGGVDIYTAVLDRGVRSLDDL